MCDRDGETYIEPYKISSLQREAWGPPEEGEGSSGEARERETG